MDILDQSLKRVNVTLHNKNTHMHTYFVDVIKLSILRWADDPGLPRGSLMQSHIFLEEESRGYLTQEEEKTT